jgi:hypothetical protein
MAALSVASDTVAALVELKKQLEEDLREARATSRSGRRPAP